MNFIKSIFKKKQPKISLDQSTLEELRAEQKKLRDEFFSKIERTEQEKGDFHAKDGELCVLINQFKKQSL